MAVCLLHPTQENQASEIMTPCRMQVRAFSFAYAGLQAAYRIHSELLTSVLAAPCVFFEQ